MATSNALAPLAVCYFLFTMLLLRWQLLIMKSVVFCNKYLLIAALPYVSTEGHCVDMG